VAADERNTDRGFVMDRDVCDQKSEMMLVFSVGAISCGLCVTNVGEICRNLEITPVFRAPAAVRGVIHLRGQVVTVVDMRTIFNSPRAGIGRESRIIVVKSMDESLGLLVDAVEDIIAVDHKNLKPPPPNVKGVAGSLFTCIYKRPFDLVAVLNLEAALALGGMNGLVRIGSE